MTQMSFQDHENALAEIRRLRRENEELQEKLRLQEFGEKHYSEHARRLKEYFPYSNVPGPQEVADRFLMAMAVVEAARKHINSGGYVLPELLNALADMEGANSKC